MSILVRWFEARSTWAPLFIRAFACVFLIYMAQDFVVALVMVHVHIPFREALDPSAMLASALFLLFNGPGPLSVDALLARRRAVSASREA